MAATPRAPRPNGAASAPSSLLGVDIGAAFTKAALFEPVDGRYRLVASGQARSTVTTHLYDGLALACREIELLSGRQLFGNDEPLSGEVSGRKGCEALAVSMTCQPPLRVLAASAKAAAAARTERCAVSVLPAGGLKERLQAASAGTWDAILGTSDELDLIAQLLGQPGAAGPKDASTSNQDGPTPLFLPDDAPDAAGQLAQLSLRRALETVPGLAELSACATEPLTTGAAAVANLAHLIATRFGLKLALIMAGAGQTMVAFAGQERGWLGLALNPGPALELPATGDDVRAQHALHERLVRSCLLEPLTVDLLIGAGALAHVARSSQTAIALLNAAQPVGVAQLALDAAGIVGPLAALAGTYPDLACQVFEHDALVGLGSAICPRGEVRPGAKVLEVRWEPESGAAEKRTVKAGELTLIPVAHAHKLRVSLYPAKGVDVGLNRPGVAASAHIDGGHMGLIVDARIDGEDRGREHWERQLE